MKTYTIEELEASRKSGMDWKEQHRKMLETLKEGGKGDPEEVLWPLPYYFDPFWRRKEIIDQEDVQTGADVVPHLPHDE